MLLIALALATMPRPVGPALPGDLGGTYALYSETRAGATRVDLTVDTAGLPVRCEVTKSGGMRALDRTACDVLMKRARFMPARDARGAPVAAVVREDFTVNEAGGLRGQGGPAATAGEVDFAVEVERLPVPGTLAVADLLLMTDAAGRVTACDVATSTRVGALDRVACRQVAATTFSPARDRGGQAVPALRQVSVGFSAQPVAR